ncbi:MAG: ATPase, partial [Bacteroidales bacterium]|nr:ATPase [Bacteroidales bacterium]
MQMLMNELFAITANKDTCTQDRISIAKKNIINVQEGSYQMQMSILSQKQKALLQAIAREGSTKAITSAAFVKKHSLSSPSSVQSAVKGLMDKDIVSSEEGCYRINDYFFSEWIKETF